MKKVMTCACVAIGLMILWGAFPPGSCWADSSDWKAVVEARVAALGADSWEEREKAQEEIVAALAGLPLAERANAVEYLSDWARGSADLEVQERIEKIIDHCVSSVLHDYYAATVSCGMSFDQLQESQRSAALYAMLREAIQKSHVPMVKILVRVKADVNQKDTLGYTPLMDAAMQPHGAEMMKCLLDAGADMHAIFEGEDGNGDEGFSVLMFAARVGIPENVRFLLDHGAGQSLELRSKWNPLSALELAQKQYREIQESTLFRYLEVDGARVDRRPLFEETIKILSEAEASRKR